MNTHNEVVELRVARFIRFYNALCFSSDPEHRKAAKSFKKFYSLSCVYAVIAAIAITAFAVLFGNNFDVVFFALGCAVFVVISSCVVALVLKETVGKDFFATLKKYSCRKCGKPNMKLSLEWTCDRCEQVNSVTDPAIKRGVVKTTLKCIAVAAILLGGSFLVATLIPDRGVYDVHIDNVEAPVTQDNVTEQDSISDDEENNDNRVEENADEIYDILENL